LYATPTTCPVIPARAFAAVRLTQPSYSRAERVL